MVNRKHYVISDKLGNMYTGKITKNELEYPQFDSRFNKAKIYLTKEEAIKECEYLIEDFFEIDDCIKVYQMKQTLIDIENPISSNTYVSGEKISNVYKIANNVLYFDDSSDFRTALYEILKELNPDLDVEEKLNYIE